MSEELYLKQVIPSYFIYEPNNSLLRRRIRELSINVNFKYHYFNGSSKAEKSFLFNVNGEDFYKIVFESDFLELKDESDFTIKHTLNNFKIEFFISYGDERGEFNYPVLMGVDELSFYLNKKMNDVLINSESFPKLFFLNSENENFISKGRILVNTYFPNYKGSIFNIFEFDSELKEIFAVASNSFAFLIRFEERVTQELNVSRNLNYSSNLHIYPRFNNAIAETAGYIYNIWERICFILQEFFPKKKSNDNYPPSFEQYFKSKNDEFKTKPNFITDEFLWFYNRLKIEHKLLGELRHPLVHYNKLRSVKGMRSAKFQSEFNYQNSIYIEKTIMTYKSEIAFLNNELLKINIALEKSLLLIENWCKLSETEN